MVLLRCFVAPAQIIRGWPAFVAAMALLARASGSGADIDGAPIRGAAVFNQPVTVYNDWSAYDELSDTVRLTEALALKQLGEIVRLKRAGVRIDYFMMDAFWYDPKGGYREFRRQDWPKGPDRWLEGCKANHILPGLWVASNYLCQMEPLAEWRDSLTMKGDSLCLFEGSFLADFMKTLQGWYDRGVRMFKFDFVDFKAATEATGRKLEAAEIVKRNVDALRQALIAFRQKNPEAILTAFNGFGGDYWGTYLPIRQSVDPRWLLAFDTRYCGDPRPADVPAMNFWRSMDIYSDHMVRYYAAIGVPIERIDNTGFMVGTTGTCCARGTAAWQSMLLLEHARGGWMNVYHGNLELIDSRKAEWFARVQRLFLPLQAFGRTCFIGGMPGNEEPYGFCSLDRAGAVYTVINPTQGVRTLRLSQVHRFRGPRLGRRVQFRDAGFVPKLAGDEITLGPEQMAVVGLGEYEKAKYDMGVQADVIVPREIQPLSVDFQPDGTNTIKASFTPNVSADLRIVFRQYYEREPLRTSRGAPPNGTTLGKMLRIEVSQDEQPAPLKLNYDKAIWSGLSWGVAEVRGRDLKAGGPITVRCRSMENDELHLTAEVYAVSY